MQLVHRRSQLSAAKQLAQQRRHPLFVIRGIGQMHHQRRRIAVFVHQREFDRARCRMTRRQPAGHLHDHPARRKQQSLGVIDPRQQLELGFEYRRRDEPHARIGLASQCAIEFIKQPRRKTPRDAAARKLPQICNARHTDAAQRIPMRPARPQQPDRQISQRRRELAHIIDLRHFTVTCRTRQHPCRLRHRRQRQPHRMALPCKTCAQIA